MNRRFFVDKRPALFLGGALLFAWLAAVGRAPAYTMRMDGDQLSLSARKTPLSAILKDFVRAGVQVKIDPRIEAYVTGTLTNEPLDKALGTLLSPYSYLIFWEVLDGPLGPLPKLTEMRIFMPGEPQSVRPFPSSYDNLQIAHSPANPKILCVQDEILVGLKPGARVEDFKLLLNQIGGVLVGSVPGLGIYQVRLPPGTDVFALVDQLKNHPILAKVEPNYAVELPGPSDAGSGTETTAPAQAPPPLKGSPPLAILDSGLKSVAGMEDAIVGQYDALHPSRALDDKLGHGTQMALIGSGAVQPYSSGGGSGAGVPIIAIRAFDDNGRASVYSMMKSLEYALQNGARVINMSWGSETDSAFMRSAVAYAQSKGMVLVAAAGNEPTQAPVYPSAYPGVVAVSALAPDLKLWDQSNYGSFISLAAPGVASFSVGYQGPPGTYAGTSISSAYTARMLALYFAQHPKATTDQALKALQNSLTDAGDSGTDPKYGHGVLDGAAVDRFLQPGQD